MMNSLMLGGYLFGVGLIGFLSYNGHVLSMLLMLEMMVLGILLSFSVYMKIFYLGSVLLLLSFYLVCESVVGISCVVLLSRAHGNELVNSMMLLSCH